MTNGEMIQKMFPSAEIDKGKDGNDIWIAIDCWTTFTKDWWNAEYKEPTTKNDLGVDCISRDSAIKALDYDIKYFEFKSGVSKHMDDIAKLLNTIYETQVNNIKALPSVTPQEPKTGHWKVVSDGYGDKAYICECSECKDTVWVYKDADRKWNYCPNCGAKMDQEDHS